MTNNISSKIRTAGGFVAGLTIVAAGFISAPGAAHASDYNLWRNNFGTTAATANTDSDTGSVDAADYVVWRKTDG